MKKFLIILAAALLLAGCQKEADGGAFGKNEGLAAGKGILISEAEGEKEPEKPQDGAENSKPEEPEEPEGPAEKIPGYGEKNADPCLILVNPDNYIPDDYSVSLKTVQGKYQLDEKAAGAAKELIAAAKEAGFDLQICSGYRTVEKSAELYKRKVNEYLNAGYAQKEAEAEAAKWVAPPGTSEHHTGLAMDIVSSDYWGKYSDLEHEFENFDSFKWLFEHCAEYGFVLRYPKDKQDVTGITYEPWHYRFVGKEAAAYIMENGLCLEEYLELL